MQALLWPLISWIFREIVIKFVLFTGLFAVLAFLVPKLIKFLEPYATGGDLSSAFGSLSPSVWFFLDFFNLGVGVPMLLSAGVTRFLIRRLPVIG